MGAAPWTAPKGSSAGMGVTALHYRGFSWPPGLGQGGCWAPTCGQGRQLAPLGAPDAAGCFGGSLEQISEDSCVYYVLYLQEPEQTF